MSVHIVDDEQRRDCPQSLCALWVPAAQGHLLCWRSSTMSPHCPRRAALHLPLRRSERGPLYFHHGLLDCQANLPIASIFAEKHLTTDLHGVALYHSSPKGANK